MFSTNHELRQTPSSAVATEVVRVWGIVATILLWESVFCKIVSVLYWKLGNMD